MLLDNLQQKQEDKQEEDSMIFPLQNWYGRPLASNEHLSLDTLQTAKEWLAKADVPMSYVNCSRDPIPVQEKKMLRHTDDDDFDFDFDRDMTEAERTRKFFLNDLEVLEENKRQKLKKDYGLIDDDPPNTFEDFILRIKNGKWAVTSGRAKDINKPCSFNPYGIDSWIRWRNDGKLEEDHIGYEKDDKILSKVTTAAERQIRVADLKDLPLILEEYENSTIH